MWLGKIALIMFMFSVAMLFTGYYLNTIFNNPTLNANTNVSYNALNTLAGTFRLNQGVNTSLIFGDFTAALTVLFDPTTGILFGGTITNAFSLIPYVDVSIQLFIRIIWAATNIFLWIYIVANRSI